VRPCGDVLLGGTFVHLVVSRLTWHDPGLILGPGVELLASGSKDCEVRIWSSDSSACLAVAAGHVAAVTAVAWTQSKAKAGKLLATGGADKLLKLWDTSKLLAAVVAAAAAAAAAAAGEDAGECLRRVLSHNDAQLLLWLLTRNTGQQLVAICSSAPSTSTT
jgi:WD40 repeat protein